MSTELVHGGNFTVMIVRVTDPGDPSFEGRLAEQIARSPGFFANAPVVLDLKDASGCATADAFHGLRRLLKRQHLIAVGIQNANATQVRAAMNADLAAFPAAGAGRRADAETAALPERTVPARPAPPPLQPPSSPNRTKIVTQPVRSGTQIYARGGDLVVLAAVSPGAEVIADGHVHIYGALRGRAIAGATGDTEARIFVGRLEAELVCVAGHYLVSEAIEPSFLKQPVQVSLIDDRLTISRT
ncbi:MAG TPA: septum site-determining protein MinC [Stellaceae bacterium]|nr:septum site-determining protein MinC [Stellaceae bacterium]